MEQWLVLHRQHIEHALTYLANEGLLKWVSYDDNNYEITIEDETHILHIKNLARDLRDWMREIDQSWAVPNGPAWVPSKYCEQCGDIAEAEMERLEKKHGLPYLDTEDYSPRQIDWARSIRAKALERNAELLPEAIRRKGDPGWWIGEKTALVRRGLTKAFRAKYLGG